jgi:murein DD-endopeptidase MepM/ murein hydrolase activator NlpD
LEKKFKFSDNPTLSKVVYGIVVALLCISAIVVGIIAANNRGTEPPAEEPPIDNGDSTPPNSDGNGDNTPPAEKPTVFMAPCVGKVIKGHSETTPVYSTTLEEWRLHTGIDVMTEENASVYAVEDGEVTKVYNDPLYGKSVEITHKNGIVSVYKNLLTDSVTLTAGSTVKRGEEIAKVGDSAIIEIADEPHLHFEMMKGEKQENPLDYIDEEAQKSSLGIE